MVTYVQRLVCAMDIFWRPIKTRVADPDLNWIRIQTGQWIRIRNIRIRIRNTRIRIRYIRIRIRNIQIRIHWPDWIRIQFGYGSGKMGKIMLNLNRVTSWPLPIKVEDSSTVPSKWRQIAHMWSINCKLQWTITLCVIPCFWVHRSSCKIVKALILWK